MGSGGCSGVVGLELSNASNSEGGGGPVSNDGVNFSVGETFASAGSGALVVGGGSAVVIENTGVGGYDAGADVGLRVLWNVGGSVSDTAGDVVGSDVFQNCGASGPSSGSGSVFSSESDAAALSSASAPANVCDATPAYCPQ